MSGTALALALLIADPVILGSEPLAITEDTDIAGETLQGQADRDQRMTVDVAVQGHGPYRFLIDTGSQRTVVSTAVAGNLGLTLGPRVRIVGMAGRDQVDTAQLDSLDIGRQSFYGLTVPLLEDRHIGADGIIGTDSLQHQRVLLDFAKNTITIGERHELGGNRGYDIVVRARRRSGRLIMTNADIDGIRVNVVVDTGSSITVGNRALQRALRDQQMGEATLSSVTGHTISANMGLANRLNIGRLNVDNVLIAFADAPAFKELKLDKRPAIFLGMREIRGFKRVAIDFDSRQILFALPQ